MNIYLLFKSIHLIAVISWMVGLLYLPRIFVYHTESIQNKKSEDLISTFNVMERRLFIYIMNPAMIVSWIFGVLLIHTIGIDNLSYHWLQLKLLFVIILTIYHFFLFQCLRRFAENNNSYSPKFYRIINEIPTILLIAIILLVVFKPLYIGGHF
jgi:putative membrane protein